MLTLGRQAYLSYKALFGWLNWPAYISTIVFRPALIVAMFGLTGEFARGAAAAERYIVGMTAFAIPHVLMGGVLQSFASERAFATLGFLFASTGNRFQAYVSRGLLHYPNAMATVASSVVFAVIFLRTDFSAANWPLVIACYLLMIATTLFYGLFLGNLAIAFRDWQVSFNIMQAVFLSLTGAVIPLASLPAGLRQISEILPVTHGLMALRDAYDGAAFSVVSENLLIEGVVGVSYLTLGYVGFRLVEVYARSTGAYETTR
jgi:ABC-2 type transport system permease protein